MVSEVNVFRLEAQDFTGASSGEREDINQRLQPARSPAPLRGLAIGDLEQGPNLLDGQVPILPLDGGATIEGDPLLGPAQSKGLARR